MKFIAFQGTSRTALIAPAPLSADSKMSDATSTVDVNVPPPSNPARRPSRPSNVDWSEALSHATTDPEQVFEQDELTVTLKDGYPKSRYHYLVVPKQELGSIGDLSASHLGLLEHMHRVAENLVTRIHSKEPQLPFKFGYHAVPSLKRLHMHVISQDFSSPLMRTQHHWNTFNTEYFVPSSLVLDTIRQCGHVEVDTDPYNALLSLSMRCCFCPRTFEDLDKLKEHLKRRHVPTA